MSMLVYLVRHGETAWNHQGLIQGHQNPSLNQLGQQQAAMVATYLEEQKLNFTGIYTSDLQRAQETGTVIAQRLGLSIISREDLRERCFGQLEGLTLAAAKARFPQVFAGYAQDPINTAFPAGESVAQFSQRVESFLAFIRSGELQSPVLVVSHGGFIRIFLAIILGLPLQYRDRLEIGNASLSIVQVAADKNKLLALNITDHLAHIS